MKKPCFPSINRDYSRISNLRVSKAMTSMSSKDKQRYTSSEHHDNELTARVKWVTEHLDYNDLQTPQIKAQFRNLIKELTKINQQAAHYIQRLALIRKPMPQKVSNTLEKQQLILQQQQLNNDAIITRLRQQLQKVQKQAETFSSITREEINEEIKATLHKLAKLKHKANDIKINTKHLGDQIMQTDSMFQHIHALEKEIDAHLDKKAKLEQRETKQAAQCNIIQQKLAKFSQNDQKVEQYFDVSKQHNEKEEEAKAMQRKHRSKLHDTEAARKRVEITQQIKQQKYHQGLKNLEQLVIKSEHLSSKLCQTEVQILQSKETIGKLQEELSRSPNTIECKTRESPMFVTEISMKNKNSHRSTATNIKSFQGKEDVNSELIQRRQKEGYGDDRDKQAVENVSEQKTENNVRKQKKQNNVCEKKEYCEEKGENIEEEQKEKISRVELLENISNIKETILQSLKRISPRVSRRRESNVDVIFEEDHQFSKENMNPATEESSSKVLQRQQNK